MRKDAGAKNENLAQLLAEKIDLKVRDGATTLTTHTVFAPRIQDIAVGQGLNTRVNLDQDTRFLHDQIRKAIAKPTFAKSGTRIRCSADSPTRGRSAP